MREMEPKSPYPTSEDPNQPPAGDESFEALLEEVARTGRPDEGVSRETLIRIVENRPFAPWEVHHRHHWRFPALAVSGIFGAAAALGFSPLARLEPSTAFSFWVDALQAASVRPLQTLWSVRSLFGDAGRILREDVMGTSLLLLSVLGLTVLAAGALGRSLRRLPISDAAR